MIIRLRLLDSGFLSVKIAIETDDNRKGVVGWMPREVTRGCREVKLGE